MSNEMRVKTTYKYNRFMGLAGNENYSFSGEIVARDPHDKHRVLVESNCGCSKWFGVDELKPEDATCNH